MSKTKATNTATNTTTARNIGAGYYFYKIYNSLKWFILFILIVGIVVLFPYWLNSQLPSTTVPTATTDFTKIYGPVQTIFTTVALIVAGIWFIRRRRAALKLDVNQDVTCIEFPETTDSIDRKIPKLIYVRVTITVNNKGEVPFELGWGHVTVSQIKPYPASTLEKMADGALFSDKERTAFDWPVIGQLGGEDGKQTIDGRNLMVKFGLKTIEPGLTDQIYADFFLENTTEIFEVYSYVENKHHKIGWSRKTIHSVKDNLLGND